MSQRVYAGDVFESPAFDLRAEVLETNQDLLRAETFVGRRGNGGPLHRHLRQEERFQVLDGALRVRQGRRESRIVEAGQEVRVPAGRPHTFRAVGDGAHFIAEFRPAYDIAEVFRDVFALSGRGRRGGQPSPRDAATLIQRYPEDFFYLAYIPIGVQRALAHLLVRRSEDDARTPDAHRPR
jgi:quercetin dioxygenase-like cupin family protein